ncbi:hypothetical protein CA267_010165 [Alteromonas pelagimontana]|uniref:Uncharacterized protein n=1 Tax=Alteromonas pelagimontana TaxID=1858656 RepID=A0A6M4MEU4_9ALTE|nr:hypothetical protein [Alteromonas pelagimontana]QJR81115.1 hypothetical protein CA267_010165 [Alteromonas pelagimontana]
MISVLAAFLTLIVGLVSPAILADDKPLAFAGALGFGKYTAGGNNGQTLVVNSLADPKNITPGTLRWAVTQSYPRNVQFAVSGIIHLQKPLKFSVITSRLMVRHRLAALLFVVRKRKLKRIR